MKLTKEDLLFLVTLLGDMGREDDKKVIERFKYLDFYGDNTLLDEYYGSDLWVRLKKELYSISTK